MSLPAVCRMHVLGMPGSGKTWLARKTASLMQIPCYELDKTAYEHGCGQRREDAMRREDIEKIVCQAGWVTEGVYLTWTGALLDAADIIVWLDMPPALCWRRIVFRHILADLKRDQAFPGVLNMLKFAAGVWPWYYGELPAELPGWESDQSSRALAEHYLACRQDKLLRLSRPREVKQLLHHLQSAHLPA